jgi:hypothetical protein
MPKAVQYEQAGSKPLLMMLCNEKGDELALHMPSHIFARLGMWQQDIDSNKASVRASEYAEKNHLGGVGHQLHAYKFLLYAYLQQADDANAQQVLDHTQAMIAHLRTVPGIENDGITIFITYFEVELPGIYYLEMHDWKAVLAIPEPANAMVSAKYSRAWELAIAAGHLRDSVVADTAAGRAESVYALLTSDGSPISDERQVAQGTIRAWQSFAHKNDDEAFQQISAAADRQDRFGGAEVDIPAREMYADMLLVDNHPIEALAQYHPSAAFRFAIGESFPVMPGSPSRSERGCRAQSGPGRALYGSVKFPYSKRQNLGS